MLFVVVFFCSLLVASPVLETIQAIEKALELARTAVEKDEKGDPQNAARYYEKASKALKKQSALVPEQYRTILLEKVL